MENVSARLHVLLARCWLGDALFIRERSYRL